MPAKTPIKINLRVVLIILLFFRYQNERTQDLLDRKMDLLRYVLGG
jgi:hypothetical protein